MPSTGTGCVIGLATGDGELTNYTISRGGCPLKPEAGLGSVPQGRSPRRQSYRKASTREKIVPGPRKDGDLVLEEVFVGESPGPASYHREGLRILARWLARAALK